MKAAIVVLTAVAVLSVCDPGRRRTLTMRPCSDRCSRELRVVCARDPSGAHYWFFNLCLLRACACRNNVEFTLLDDCPSDARMRCSRLLKNVLMFSGALEVPRARSKSSNDARRRSQNADRFLSCSCNGISCTTSNS